MRRSDIYDVSAELEKEFGPVGSDSWKEAVQQAWDEYSAQILLDARKQAKKTLLSSGFCNWYVLQPDCCFVLLPLPFLP